MASNKYTFFVATTVAQTIIPANPGRRRMRIVSFANDGVSITDNNTVWVNTTGAGAVVLQCWQMLPGAVWDYGGPDDFITPLMMSFPSCPTGAISVVTAIGTHAGMIEEFS